MSAERRNLRAVAEFSSLRNLQTALPCTKMGMFRQLLPEIEHLLRLGHRSKAICDCLRADGLDLGYDAFPVYLRRARRGLRDSNPEMLTAPNFARERSQVLTCGNVEGGLNEHPSLDPFAGVRRSRQKEARERFEYDPLAPVKENLLK
jgi:hypothetical protein